MKLFALSVLALTLAGFVGTAHAGPGCGGSKPDTVEAPAPTTGT